MKTTRSTFIRNALKQALLAHRVRRLEELDAAGYQAIPTTDAESEEWLTEQEWGDEWDGER